MIIENWRQLEIPFETEKWRDIPEYEGVYQVSNLGRVKSLNYNGTGKEKVMKPITDKDGYLFVTLCKNRNKKMYKVHRLVAQAFIPNNDPEHKTEVNHINEDKTDNRTCNLNWMTRKQNVNWGSGIKRSSQKRSKPIKQLSLDGALVTIWPSIMEVERKNGFAPNNICKCCNGKYKTAYGFRWEYA
jgi:hypothetical protein